MPGSLGGRWGLSDLIDCLLGGRRGFRRTRSIPLVSHQTTHIVTVQVKGWIETHEILCFQPFRKASDWHFVVEIFLREAI